MGLTFSCSAQYIREQTVQNTFAAFQKTPFLLQTSHEWRLPPDLAEGKSLNATLATSLKE